MDLAVVISSVVLCLSVLATIAKFLDWFVHSDPKTMVRTTRWMLVLLVLACIPVLWLAIANEQWPLAMLVGAGMLIVPTFLKWRVMLAPLRAAFDHFRPRPRPFDMEVWDPDDPQTVRRAAAILEAYVGKSNLVALSDQRRPSHDGADHDAGSHDATDRTMSRREAFEVLGLEPGAGEAAIRAAHKRLLAVVHPDRDGTAYLARKVQQARDALLAPSSQEWLESSAEVLGPPSTSAKQ